MASSALDAAARSASLNILLQVSLLGGELATHRPNDDNCGKMNSPTLLPGPRESEFVRSERVRASSTSQPRYERGRRASSGIS